MPPNADVVVTTLFVASLPVPFAFKITPRFPEATVILDEERKLCNQL